MMYLLGTTLAVAACVLFAVGTPIALWYTLRMTRHRITAPRTARDFWGLNRANLLFFPEMLDDKGQELRRRALRGWMYLLLGALLTGGSMLLGVFGPLVAH